MQTFIFCISQSPPPILPIGTFKNLVNSSYDCSKRSPVCTTKIDGKFNFARIPAPITVLPPPVATSTTNL